jgi:N-acetylglucosaminyldiphosphoundecaprenol N-acetyl-beta-D-mannosaminyltransferase
VRFALGVGGAFDVIAGLRRRAPAWAQGAGLEWLFRLAQEPGRLGPRYLTTNASFALMLSVALVRRALGGRGGRPTGPGADR